MTKLIDMEISNNRLFLTFENGGYIKVSNLNLFTINIAECNKELNYIEFFQNKFDEIEIYNNTAQSMIDELKIKESDLSKSEILKKMEQDGFWMDFFSIQYDEYDNKYCHKHRCLICSNGKAILLKLTDIAFSEQRTPFEILQNVVKILKENFEVCEVAENLKNYGNVELRLKDVFIEFRDIYERRQVEERKRELKSEENQKFRYVAKNKELLYSNLQKQVLESDYDLILAYSNYNFNYLINNKLTKPSKNLRDCIYNDIKYYITNLLKSKGFDLSIYEILFTNFEIRNSKKLLLKFDAEQIGPDHDKKWQISNFSFSTINN